MRHQLISKVFEVNLPGMLGNLATLDSTEEPLVLDFQRVEYWTPAAIVSLCAMVNRWIEQGREIAFENVEKSSACSYLQRIDFFERVGLRLPEHFQRRDPRTSFVEIQQIYPGFARLSEPVPKRLAECLAGTREESNEVLRFSQYALGEVIANCQQHAGLSVPAMPGGTTSEMEVWKLAFFRVTGNFRERVFPFSSTGARSMIFGEWWLRQGKQST